MCTANTKIFSVIKMLSVLTRRKFIRVLCYPLALCAVLGISNLKQTQALRQSEKELDLICTRSALGLCESSLTLSDTLLEMALCGNERRLCELSRVAESNAKAAKEQLSVFDLGAAELYAFYTAAADCARGMSLTASPTEEERETAIAISRKARELYTALSLSAEGALAGADTPAQLEQSIVKNTGGLDLSVTVRSARAPAVIVSQTASLPLITREQAAKVAADYLGLPAVLMRGGEEQDGLIPLYFFSYSDTAICVTKNGGIIYSLFCAAPCGEIQLTTDRAREIAFKTAGELGYNSVTCIEQSKNGSRADFTFVYYNDGVLYYPDKLLMSVCLATGKVIRIDASGYLQNHCERELPPKPQDMSAVRSLVPDGFSLNEVMLALINVDGSECLCYRVECTYDGVAARIFYDISSLEEKKVEIFGS